MDPRPRTDEQKAVIVAEKLSYWAEPPHPQTISEWRSDPLYAQRRDEILGDDRMVDRIQYWAQQKFLEDVLPGYEMILKSPVKYRNLWWKVAEQIREMAGYRERKQEVSITVLEFLRVHVGVPGELPPPPMISIERAEDGTVIDAEFKLLSS